MVLRVCQQRLSDVHQSRRTHFRVDFPGPGQEGRFARDRGSLGPWLFGVANRVAAKSRTATQRPRTATRVPVRQATRDPGTDGARRPAGRRRRLARRGRAASGPVSSPRRPLLLGRAVAGGGRGQARLADRDGGEPPRTGEGSASETDWPGAGVVLSTTMLRGSLAANAPAVRCSSITRSKPPSASPKVDRRPHGPSRHT